MILSEAEAVQFAAICVALGQLGAYASATPLQWGERHTDDDDDRPRLADERISWLLSLANQGKP